MFLIKPSYLRCTRQQRELNHQLEAPFNSPPIRPEGFGKRLPECTASKARVSSLHLLCLSQNRFRQRKEDINKKGPNRTCAIGEEYSTDTAHNARGD